MSEDAPMTAYSRWRAAARPGKLLRTKRDRWVLGIAAALVALGLIIPSVLLFASAPGTQVTAYFAQTIGVYAGSTVRVLGVPVGTVNSVQPDGAFVRVTMTVNSGIAVPADADAAVVAPSVVADRYIQLTPAYTGGPQMTSGAVIPAARTAVPIEVDQLYASLAKLANALGPNGANAHGALSDLIKTGATNLNGNGAYLRQMITEFGGLSRALGGSAGNLFATVANLQAFTTMLKNNNGQVKLAEQQLAEVSSFLAADRQDLSSAISELAVALNQVKSFIGGNRKLLVANIGKLAAITSLLSQERASLAEALDDAPLAADNLVNAYDTTHHTLDGRGDLNEFSMTNVTAAGTTADLDPGGSVAPPGTVPVLESELSSLPPLPLPTVGTVYATPEALLRSAR
jgi:phospholipid/cholesterol/gamma-HCH transport system substrate-binding protein